MMPNVSSAQLQRTLDNNPKLRQDLCCSLAVESSEDPVPHCLLSDVLSNPGPWWRLRVTWAGPDLAMTDYAVYRDLVSRFGGPATTVRIFCSSEPRLGHRPDIRTEGEAVSETGDRFTQFMLHPSQLSALHTSPPLAYLTGPPGTGKTLLLILKGLEWLRQDKDVLVLGIRDESVAVSRLIAHQLEQTVAPSARSRIHHVTIHLDQARRTGEQAMQDSVSLVVEKARHGCLYVIVDEANDVSEIKYRGSKDFADFIKRLKQKVEQLHLWAASLYHGGAPSTMTEVVLTEPLRTPPAVTAEVEKSGYIQQALVYPYTSSPSPALCAGPAPRIVSHAGQGHVADDPSDCEKCGKEVARELTEELHVGVTVSGRQTNSPPLRYKDVFLLTDPDFPLTDSPGDGPTATSGVIRGLRQAGVPVRMVVSAEKASAHPAFPVVTASDLASTEGPDVVVAASSGQVEGLERKVVVFVDSGGADFYGRLLAMSRCIAQLVWIKPP